MSEQSEAVFNRIYRHGSWSSAASTLTQIGDPRYYYKDVTSRKSASGTGSDLGEMSSIALSFLVNVINMYNVSSLIDVPCGDVNWQFTAWETDSLRSYVGLDISSDIIKLNHNRFRHHNNKRFAAWDIAQCDLPNMTHHSGSSQPAELVHVRDVLQHMPLPRALGAVTRIVSSRIPLLIATTYPQSSNATTNRRIIEGGWYANDLSSPPFSFPKPTMCVPSHRRMSRFDYDHTCLYIFTPSVRKRWMRRLERYE